jgi:hypothetical protein
MGKPTRKDRHIETVSLTIIIGVVSFSEKGINHEPSAPYTPEQNGTVERKNKVLKEKVRCMQMRVSRWRLLTQVSYSKTSFRLGFITLGFLPHIASSRVFP